MTKARSARPARPWLVVLLLGALLLQGAVLIRRTGTAYNEPLWIAAGYWYTNIGLGFTIREHPPLSHYLTGMLLLNLDLIIPKASGSQDQKVSGAEFSQHFLFRNRVHPWKILHRARLGSLALTFFLGIILWLWGKDTAGAAAGTAALFFCAFEPNLLAHGTLVDTDISVTVFMAATLACWTRFLSQDRLRWSLAAGLAAGLALSCKLNALALLPVMGLTLAWPAGRRGSKDLKHGVQALAIVLVAAVLVLILLYTPKHAHYFFDSLAYRFALVTAQVPSFFLGEVYPEGHLLYFPVTMLLKTPLPLLALALFAVVSPGIRREHPHAVRTAGLMILIIIAASLASKRQHGLRYILPAYPALCLLAGLAAANLWEQGFRKKLLAGAAVIWTMASVLSNFPHQLSYFNELAGPSSRAYRVLGDSSLDWGQSLPELRSFMDENPGSVILSYFGQDCPRIYKIMAQEAFSTPGLCSGRSRPNPVDTDREWLVVSATKWQGFYARGTHIWSWLREMQPYTVLGNSLLVFDITFNSDAHRKLAEMYDQAGLKAFARRERLRAARIDG